MPDPRDPQQPPPTPDTAIPFWRRVAELAHIDGEIDSISAAAHIASNWFQSKLPASPTPPPSSLLPAGYQAAFARQEAEQKVREAEHQTARDATWKAIADPVKEFGRQFYDRNKSLVTPDPGVRAVADTAHQAITERSDAVRAALPKAPVSVPLHGPMRGLTLNTDLTKPLDLMVGAQTNWLPHMAVDQVADASTSGGVLQNVDVPGVGPALHALGGAGGHLATMLPGLTHEIDDAARGIRAYHGSPHDFDRFDLTKIGSGEGAQAYGHGLYFAENENVARDYRNRLGGRQDLKVEGGGRLPNWVAERIKGIQEGRPVGTVDDLITEFKARIGEAEERVASQAPQWWNDQSNIPGLREVVQGLENVKQGAKIAPAGRMYEVNLNVDPAHLLDWDRALREQSPHVQNALRGAEVAPDPVAWQWQPHRATSADVAAKTFGPNIDVGDWVAVQRDATGKVQYHGGVSFPTEAAAAQNAAKRQGVAGVSPRDRGENLYRDLQSKTGGGSRASELLDQAGIPGLRYLDQGSRASGQGTHNYAMFTDTPIDILRKYGIVPPLAAAAAASQLGGDDPDHPGAAAGIGMMAALPFMPIKLPRGFGTVAGGMRRGEEAMHPLRVPIRDRVARLLDLADELPRQPNWRGINDPAFTAAFGGNVPEAIRHLGVFAANTPTTDVPQSAREAAAAQAWRLLHPGQELTQAQARRLPGQKIGAAGSKFGNVNRAWRDEPFSKDSLKVEEMRNFMLNRAGPVGHPMARSARPADIQWDRATPLIGLPHDRHMIYGTGGGADELLDQEYEPARQLFSRWEGLIHPTTGRPLAGNQGGLTNKDIYDRFTWSLANTLADLRPESSLQESFGRFWTGAQQNKLLEQGKRPTFDGGLLDIYGAQGLLEPGALTDEERIQRALKRSKAWGNLGWEEK